MTDFQGADMTAPDVQRAFLMALFEAAVAAADPLLRIPPFLPPPPRGRLIIVGAGKGAAAMAQAAECHYAAVLNNGRAPEGVVVTRYGHTVPCTYVAVREAGHPDPDANSVAAARALRTAVTGLTKEDLVVALISGGGSAVLAEPVPGVTLAMKREAVAALMAAGAPIAALNLVRRCLSVIKGGGLAAAARPAPVVSLVISDVPGDDPALVASGPTIPAARDGAAALAVFARYGVRPAPAVAAWLERATATAPAPHPEDRVHLVASPHLSLLAAAAVARAQGITPLILGDALEGDAEAMAQVLAGIAVSVHSHGVPVAAPAVLLSGGEATVVVRGAGRGGPNTHTALALAGLQGLAPGLAALVCDTDGLDGTGPAAGAVVTDAVRQRARALGLVPEAFLARTESHAFFDAADGLVLTGPTRTNVNDFRAILIP